MRAFRLPWSESRFGKERSDLQEQSLERFGQGSPRPSCGSPPRKHSSRVLDTERVRAENDSYGSIQANAGLGGGFTGEVWSGVQHSVAALDPRRPTKRAVWRIFQKGLHRSRRYAAAVKTMFVESRRISHVGVGRPVELPAMQLPDNASDSGERSHYSRSSTCSSTCKSTCSSTFSSSSHSSQSCQSISSDASTAASEGKREGHASFRPGLVDGVVAKQPEDGSCLFHSLAFGLGSGTSGAALRKQIVSFIVAHPDAKIANTTIKEWIRMTSGKNPEAYTKELNNRGTWGGALELAVAARIKSVNIDVYESFEGQFRCITAFREPSATRTLNLLYSTEPCRHYDALVIKKILT